MSAETRAGVKDVAWWTAGEAPPLLADEAVDGARSSRRASFSSAAACSRSCQKPRVISTLRAPERWPLAPALVAKRPPWAKGEEGEGGALSDGLVGDERSALCRLLEPERDIDVSEGERLPSSSRAWYAGRATVASSEPAIRLKDEERVDEEKRSGP